MNSFDISGYTVCCIVADKGFNTVMKHRKTIFWMIILIPLLLVVPVNVVIVRSALREVTRIRDSEVENNDRFVATVAASVEDEMGAMDTYVRLLTTEQTEYFRMLSFHDSGQSGFWAAESQLRKEMSAFMATHSFVRSMTLYFRQTDLIINRDNFRQREKSRILSDISDILRGNKEAQALDPKNNRWWLIRSEGQMFIALIHRDTDASVMAMVSLDEMLETASEGSPGMAYFSAGDSIFTISKENIVRVKQEDGISWLSDDKTYYDSELSIRDLDLTFGSLLDKKEISDELFRMTRLLFAAALLSCLIGPAISVFFYWVVERPLSQMTDSMDRIKHGDMGYRIPTDRKRIHTEFDDLKAEFNSMLDEVEHSRNALYEKEIDTQKVQLRYLGQQIRPHFILNALNIIYTCDESEIGLIRKMVLYLTKYFRYLVNLNTDYVYLSDEMEFVKNYLNIQKLRYPDRFVYFAEWEDELSEAKIPAVVIQTFVENSIKYSFERDKAIYIVILARQYGEDRIELMISDTGKGFQEETLVKIRRFLESHEYSEELGVGIQNVVSRLDLLYSDCYSISIGNGDGGGARVRLLLPLVLQEEQTEEAEEPPCLTADPDTIKDKRAQRREHLDQSSSCR